MQNQVETRRTNTVAVATIVARLFAAFPHSKPDMLEASTQVYADALLDVPPNKLRLAVEELIRSEKFLPSIAQIRTAAENAADPRTRQQSTDGGLKPFVLWSKKGVGLMREEETIEHAVWRNHVRFFAEKNDPDAWWSETRGPKPGKPGCLAPHAILREFGFQPIREPKDGR